MKASWLLPLESLLANEESTNIRAFTARQGESAKCSKEAGIRGAQTKVINSEVIRIVQRFWYGEGHALIGEKNFN